MEPDGPFPHGLDYAWLAADAAGHVAVFTNAGQGPIPIAVLADRRASDRAEPLVKALPERDEAHLLIELPRPDDFAAFARRRLFAYDWQDGHRDAGRSDRYELLARPAVPITVEELRGELVALIDRVRFESLRFDDGLAIAVEDHWESRRA